jgi:hypothetical protein
VVCALFTQTKKNRNHVFEGERRSSKDFGSGTCLIFSFDNVGSEREREREMGSPILFGILLYYISQSNQRIKRERERVNYFIYRHVFTDLYVDVLRFFFLICHICIYI